MRASRLVSILLILQTRGRITARELADTLEVSVRTIYRDVEALGAAGVPIYGESGREGGYRLLDGYRTRLTGLTVDEARSVFLTGLPGAAADLGLGAAVTAAKLKLLAALPAEQRASAELMWQRFQLDPLGWYRDAEANPYLAAAVEATWSQRRVWMRYVRWAAPSETTRTVEPYGVVLKAGTWYLVANHAGAVRSYRVSRIQDLRVLPERFERPEGFDLAGYWRGYLAEFDARRHVDDAVVRLSADAYDRLPYVWEPAVVQAAQRTATPDGDGRVRVTIPVESLDQAVRELLKLAAGAEVLAPRALRDAMVGTIDALRSVYRGDG